MSGRPSTSSATPLWISAIFVSGWSVLGMFWAVDAAYYPVYRPESSALLLWVAFFVAVCAGVLSVVVGPIVGAGTWGSKHRRQIAWTALGVSVGGLLAASVILNLAGG